jgi:3-oxoisoapionate decarboxylase
MRIGTTTFGFRYSFLDRARSPALGEVIRQARSAGVGCLQVCENVRPLEMTKTQWREAVRCAADLGVELQLGCKTLSAAVVEQYLGLARELRCDQLRIVMEDAHQHPTRDGVRRLLDAVIPKMQAAGMRLAVENHFDIASAVLREAVSSYPSNVAGYCIDTANSLRSFEPLSEVLRLLSERAFCYHLKDYRLVGSMIGFCVEGAPLGEGDLDLNFCIEEVFRRRTVPPLYVETWTPSKNSRGRDIALEADWLKRSVRNLRIHLRKFEKEKTPGGGGKI